MAMLQPYSGPKLSFELTLPVGHLIATGRDFIGYTPTNASDELVYRPDPNILGDMKRVREEVKFDLSHGLYPVLVYPDGHEEVIYSFGAARRFIREIRNMCPAEWLCTPEEYFAAVKKKAA